MEYYLAVYWSELENFSLSIVKGSLCLDSSFSNAKQYRFVLGSQNGDRSNPDFSISSCKVHRKKKMMDDGAWVSSFSASLELASNSAWAGAQPWASFMSAYESLWEKTLKLRTWNAMCKKLSGSWVLTYYHEDALLCWGHKNTPKNLPTRCIIIQGTHITCNRNIR